MFIIRRSKLYYTASVIITHAGGRPVHRLREVLLMMSTWCSKHVEEYNNFIIKQEFVR